MEILFAYALLLCEGYDLWQQYSEELDRLFLNEPENDMYLYLETTTDMKQAVMHILSETEETPLDYEIFGRTLMKLAGDIYLESNLYDFTKRMYSLSHNLPSQISMEKPFFILGYADDVLEYGGERECRELLENAIHYYTRK